MRKTIKIESVILIDNTCGFGEYLYTPVSIAFRWIVSRVEEFESTSVVKFKQKDEKNMAITLRGKRADIQGIITNFVCYCGDKFSVK